MKYHSKTAAAKAAQFAEVTKNLIRSGNITRAKKCLDIAELLFVTGSNETRKAISKTYINSVSVFMGLHNFTISHLFPPLLKHEYMAQVNACAQ